QTKGLTFAYGDVRPTGSGGLHDGAGDGIDAHDILGAGGMDNLANGGSILHVSIVVGLLEIEAGGISAQHVLEGIRISTAILFRNNDQFCAGTKAVSAHGLNHVGMSAGGHIGSGPLAVLAHGDGLGGGGTAVVN